MATSTDRLCLIAATAIVPSLAACTALAAGGTGTALDAGRTVTAHASDGETVTASAVIEKIVELSASGELVRAELRTGPNRIQSGQFRAEHARS